MNALNSTVRSSLLELLNQNVIYCQAITTFYLPQIRLTMENSEYFNFNLFSE